MMRIIGSILSIGGLAGLVYTLTNYLNETASFGFMGADIVVSKGDITPVIISAVVMLLGITILYISKKK